jgi:hypothetical protein
MGQPWSRESLKVLGADVVRITEGNMDGRVIASARPTRRGLRLWHVWTLFVRESGGLGFGQRRNTAGPHREDEESKPVMHEPEKSDSAIVATKPANKTGQPVAELVERRAGTGRNANQQSTCRAQNRESVSQALGRVRQAATIRCLPPIRLVGAGCLNWARPDLCGGTGVTRFPCTLQLARRATISRWSSKESGESYGSLWSTNLCGRLGPASPSSAVHAGRYPGTRQAADPAYKVARRGALLCPSSIMVARSE